MGPPRRTPSKAVISTPQTSLNDSSEPPQSPIAERHRSQTSAPPGQTDQPKLGMSPASRYKHNLKVLRRRDPSIVSIFDQFSHVCLYHHNGKKWEKQGYEGSMFLYERESYPPYGFYILNRMGMDDHIQRIYPEDGIGAHGSYLIIRSYPEYTSRRLAVARSSSPHEVPHKFSDVYAIPNIETLPNEAKGEAVTIGLWMFATDAREPMIDVLMRLHSYIKKNIPYPDEFRYGPERPPPPNPHLRTTTAPSASPQSDGREAPLSTVPSSSQTTHSQGQFAAHHPSQVYSNGGTSELDKLFARIEPTPVLSAAVASSSAPISNMTSKMTVESLFAALGGGEMMEPKHDTSQGGFRPASTSSTGISLLDSIFASASNNTINVGTSHTDRLQPSAAQPTTGQSTTGQQSITIYSPAPSTKILPQILNQDVISNLLGLPPSRTASAASTAYSTGAHSHPSSREGDNEDEGDVYGGRRLGGGSDGYSESSTVLDPEAEYDEELQAAGASAGRPLLADLGQQVTNNGYLGAGDQGRVHGDVTPRAPINGFITPPFSRPNGHRFHGASNVQTTGSIEPSLSMSTIIAPRDMEDSSLSNDQPLSRRRLVPFEDDSELWPYPRASTSESTGDADGDEIIELDFEDTSALSDPNAFKKALQNKHVRSVSGNSGGEGTKEKGKGRKKGKKERAAEQVRLREEIEKSWDVPSSSAQVYGDPDGPASPSPCPSPEIIPPSPRQPSSVSVAAASINGVTHKTSQVKGKEAPLDPDVARESIVAAISSQVRPAVQMERNEFVREVLTLIHTDKTFVDKLWQEYMGRLA